MELLAKKTKKNSIIRIEHSVDTKAAAKTCNIQEQVLGQPSQSFNPSKTLQILEMSLALRWLKS